MQIDESTTERRKCDRRRCVGDTHMVWRQQQATRGGAHGWLWDISSSGVGFVADSDRAPGPGEEIQVHPDRGPNNFVCRVVRTTQMNDTSILVGCELTSAGPAPTALILPHGPQYLESAISRAAQAVLTPAAFRLRDTNPWDANVASA